MRRVRKAAVHPSIALTVLFGSALAFAWATFALRWSLGLMKVVESAWLHVALAAVVAGAPAVGYLTSLRRLSAGRDPREHAFGLGWLALPRGDTKACGPWEAALLVSSLAIAVVYVLIGSEALGPEDNDAAYYFGVAKHIVESGRFEEPIVWQFLDPPASIRHPPFDYWQAMTSLLLLPSMAWFGPTYSVAAVTMAVLSGLTLFAFWYLICIAEPPRHRVLQLPALLLFAFSPSMAVYRFDTETVVPYQLFLLLALIGWVQRKYILTTVAAFLMVLTRADAAIVCLMLWAGVALSAARQGGFRLSSPALRATLATMALLVVAYVAWYALLFGTLLQPAAAEAPRIRTYDDLLTYGLRLPDGTGPWARLTLVAVSEAAARVFEALIEVPFVPIQALWLALLLVPARDSALKRLIPAIVFAAPVLVVWSSPVVFAQWRTLHVLLPAVAAGGLVGLDAALARSQGAPGSPAFGFRQAFTALLALGAAALLLATADAYGPRSSQMTSLSRSLAELDPKLGGQPVASDRPWYVIAATRSPAISIPANGEDAMVRAVERYRVSFLLLTSSSGCRGRSSRVCDRIYDGKKTQLGELELELAAEHDGLRLFRLTEAKAKATPELRKAKAKARPSR